MKIITIISILTGLLLVGCGQDEITVESKQPEKELSIVEQKNAQEWEDGRIYITEHNYVSYQDNNGKPKYYVYKAKEWPREDINNESSYDLPRVVFRWDNGARDSSSEEDYYERKDKVWSIKTDGTDLRLVADEFKGKVRLMRISPNNRYLALAYANDRGMFKVIKDLKTGEYIELGKSRGHPEFLWAEDSSYLYFTDQWQNWKYNLLTLKIDEVDVQYNEYSVIYDGKRYVLNQFGVVVYDEETNSRLYSVGVNPDESSLNTYEFIKRSISPTGRFAWGESGSKRFLIDTHNKTFSSENKESTGIGKYQYFEIIGLNANYVRYGSGKTVSFKLNDNKQIDDNYKSWVQIATGHSATEPSLYNAFANSGSFEK
ncbi:Tricorn protease domain-containing protein [Photobacterium sp. 2_MG-2023]|uniref:Tricorn protease domain-containing protein n=1 Tax=Photobacterium sp. 2_MG-2023 TaxID=3062663 RepID=UPI0026E48BF1|nr:Tricorn protease domain-containing protein [Photobacterium sp. 2_MG-2023]MDO6583523.1 Tricorn protease domain-containing protein [Photobacterium sp. 2_MG-2023]